jgi:ankyrin repeat protein
MTKNLHLAVCIGLVVGSVTLVTAQSPPSVIDAVHKGHAVGHEQDGIEAVREALAARSDVNERDRTGWTPLMHAALECRPGIVKLLLDRGADVTLRANSERTTSFMDHGQSALTIAASCFIARRRAVLAPRRGMPHAYVRSELTAPQEIVQKLIHNGADVNGSDADGKTPLMMAAMHGWEGVVEELLTAKAAVSARDREGRLAIDYADTQDLAIVRLLRNAGSSAPTGRSGRTVCDAERVLDRLGYDTPIIDCILGQQLSAVISRFQKDHQLRLTGELDSATRRSLGIR